MDSQALKENFETQLKNVGEQIAQLEADLAKAKEYRTKLEGGLETLALLNGESEEAPAESATAEVVSSTEAE